LIGRNVALSSTNHNGGNHRHMNDPRDFVFNMGEMSMNDEDDDDMSGMSHPGTACTQS